MSLLLANEMYGIYVFPPCLALLHFDGIPGFWSHGASLAYG